MGESFYSSMLIVLCFRICPPGFFVLPDTPRIWHQPPYLSGGVITGASFQGKQIIKNSDIFDN
jgi:hypothetical protein